MVFRVQLWHRSCVQIVRFSLTLHTTWQTSALAQTLCVPLTLLWKTLSEITTQHSIWCHYQSMSLRRTPPLGQRRLSLSIHLVQVRIKRERGSTKEVRTSPQVQMLHPKGMRVAWAVMQRTGPYVLTSTSAVARKHRWVAHALKGVMFVSKEGASKRMPIRMHIRVRCPPPMSDYQRRLQQFKMRLMLSYLRSFAVLQV